MNSLKAGLTTSAFRLGQVITTLFCNKAMRPVAQRTREFRIDNKNVPQDMK